MNIFKSENYWFSSSYLFFFFISWSVWWSFYPIWLNGTLGLTGSQTGMVFSVYFTDSGYWENDKLIYKLDFPKPQAIE